MAYTATGSLLTQDRTAKIPNNHGIGIFQGSCDVTNYNSALSAISFITGRFQSILCVMAQETDNGYTPEWVTASSSFKLWKNNATTGGPLVELGEDVDAGGFTFFVVGQV